MFRIGSFKRSSSWTGLNHPTDALGNRPMSALGQSPAGGVEVSKRFTPLMEANWSQSRQESVEASRNGAALSPTLRIQQAPNPTSAEIARLAPGQTIQHIHRLAPTHCHELRRQTCRAPVIARNSGLAVPAETQVR
jgi:hypothetical protein